MTTIPNLTNVHGPSVVLRQEILRVLFVNMLRKPLAVRAQSVEIFERIETLHGANRALFGWVDAELIRSQAMAEAMAAQAPAAPGVAESLFGDLPCAA